MEKKKGFTLIELLAVIVILAIIAIIATPIVLNIIKDSKKSALLRSAELYLSTATQSVVAEQMNPQNKFMPSKCSINQDGNLLCDYYANEIEVEMKGQKPTGGTIVFSKGKITKQRLIYPEGIIERDTFGNLVFVEEGGSTTITTPAVLQGDIYISKVEDLMTVAQKLNDYQVGEVNLILVDDIDFASDDSYRDPEDKSYGNLNYDYKMDGDGNYIKDSNNDPIPLVEGIKKELTTGYGLVYGISTAQDEDTDLNITSFGEYSTTHVDSKIPDLEDLILNYNPEEMAYIDLETVASGESFQSCNTNLTIECYYQLDSEMSNKIGVEPYTKEEIDAMDLMSESEEAMSVFMSKYITYYDENRPSPDFKGFEDERTKILNGATEASDIKQNIENYISTNKLDSNDFTAMWGMYEKEYIILDNVLNYYIIEKYFPQETAHKFKETTFAKVNYFDGQNNEIKNYLGATGLFNVVGSPIKNIKMINANVIGSDVGILVNATSSYISNVEVSGTISGSSYVGGVVGFAFGSKIENVTSDVKMIATSGYAQLGGIVGNSYTNIINSSSKGTIGEGKGDVCAGLAARSNVSTNEIKNSHSTVNINCDPGAYDDNSSVGGLIGLVYSSGSSDDKITINNSYYKGEITSQTDNYTHASRYGGLIGKTRTKIEINDSYAITNITNGADSYDMIGGIIGYAVSDITINKAFYKGSISTINGTVGGIIGYVGDRYSKTNITIDNVYSLGNITSTGSFSSGGIIAYSDNMNLSLSNSYSNMNISGANMYSVSGIIGEASSSYYSLIETNDYGTYYLMNLENNLYIGNITSNEGDTAQPIYKVYNASYITSNLTNVFASKTNKINGTAITYDSLATTDNLNTTSWYTDTLKLSSDVWEFKAGYLPHLKGLDNQEWVSVPTE